MNVSIILSTYNSPLWLEKVLWGYSCQTHRDFEIVIADDGSQDTTRQLIDRMRDQTGLSISHVWQEDKGFRKCRILNKAVLQTRYEYIVFSDGDCIPRPDFVQTHASQARAGHYLSGGYFKLPLVTSQAISREDILSGRCFDTRWLRRNGLGLWRKTLKLSASPSMTHWLNRLTTTRCNFKGSNASAWKQNILAVNGFDERMPWGGEDREFGVRLINSGIQPKHVRYDAVVIHLDHGRSYVDPELVRKNRQLRLYNQHNGVCYTDYGISAHVEAGSKDAGV
ncbi:MAG: glycosyltransferase family 2 protein [Pseudohongiellaceae bacterium]